MLRHLVFAAALAGCYQSDLPSCNVSCATTADCPGQLACNAGRCSATPTECDPSSDAPPDTPAGAIRVVVLDDRGLPAIGIRVIATAADGSSIAEVTTVADGSATIPTTGPTDVTAVRTTGLGSSLTTILAAEPGDTLTFGRRRNEAPSVSRTLTWTTDPAAFKYTARVSCGDTFAIVNAQGGLATQSTTLSLDPTCADDFDAMVTYFTQFTTEQGVQVATGNTGNVMLDAGFADFTGEAANFTQLPPGVGLGNMRFTGKTVFRLADPAFGQGAFAILTGNGIAANAVLALPTAGAVGRELAFGASHDDDIKRVQQVAERVPPQGQYNLNVEPVLLPWMTSAPVVDLGAKTITWTQTSAGPLARSSGDLIAAEVTYGRGGSTFRWRIIGPPSAAAPTGPAGEFAIAIPDVPGVEAFEPLATDTLGPTQAVRNYGFTGAGTVDYAVLRSSADLAISTAIDTFVPSDSFLTTGLTSIDISRMVVSIYTL